MMQSTIDFISVISFLSFHIPITFIVSVFYIIREDTTSRRIRVGIYINSVLLYNIFLIYSFFMMLILVPFLVSKIDFNLDYIQPLWLKNIVNIFLIQLAVWYLPISILIFSVIVINPFTYFQKPSQISFSNIANSVLNKLFQLRKDVDLGKYKYLFDHKKIELPVFVSLSSNISTYEQQRLQRRTEVLQPLVNKQNKILNSLKIYVVGVNILYYSHLWFIGFNFSSANSLISFLFFVAVLIQYYLIAILYLRIISPPIVIKNKIFIDNNIDKYQISEAKIFKTEVMTPFWESIGATPHYDQLNNNFIPTLLGYNNEAEIAILRSHLFDNDVIQKYYFNINDYASLAINNRSVKIIDFRFGPTVGENRRAPKNYQLYDNTVLIEVDFAEEFEGVTKVYSRAKGNFDLLIEYNKDLVSNKIDTESIIFNDIFIAFSDNQVEARRALKTNVMERLIYLYGINKSVYFSLRKNKAYILLEQKSDMFELNYLNPNTNDAQIASQSLQEQLEILIQLAALINPREK
jgi:hypothetical protein